MEPVACLYDIAEDPGRADADGAPVPERAHLQHPADQDRPDQVRADLVDRVDLDAQPDQRGCQLSIRVTDSDRTLFDALTERGVFVDWREPDVIRAAPVPLYNSFTDVYRFAQVLKECLVLQ